MKIALKTLAASVWAATLMGSQSAMAQPVDALEVNDYVYVNSTGDNQTADVTVCDNFFSPSGCWYMSYNWLGTGDFTIYDLISGSTPFTILVGEEEGAADNALFIDASGKVGVGTSTPGDTAGSRLTVGLNDLGDSSIFLPTPTANFALVNSGDYIGFGDNDAVSVPFGIDAGSDSNSLWVAPGGLVGVGTNTPAAKLHLASETAAKLLVENTGAATGTRIMLNVVNDGGTRFDMTDNSTGNNWVFQNQFGTFDVTLAGTGTREFRFYPNGNLEIAGSYLQSSSRAIKHDIKPVDQRSVLDKVVALPINQWSYNREEGVRHMGPMSEDFYASFGLGGTDKGITTVDAGGVALAAIQGLKQEKDSEMAALTRLSEQKDARIEDLQAQLREQEDRMMQLELALTELMRQQSSQPRLGSLD